MADHPRLLLTAALVAMLAAPLAARAADAPVATAPIPPPLPSAPDKPLTIPSPPKPATHSALRATPPPGLKATPPSPSRTVSAKAHPPRVATHRRVVAHHTVHRAKPVPHHAVAQRAPTPAPTPTATPRPIRRHYYAAVLPPVPPPWYGYYPAPWRRAVVLPW